MSNNKKAKNSKVKPSFGDDFDTETLEPKIYLLPNLMTAGNLFCGFAAIMLIFKGMAQEDLNAVYFHNAIFLIFGACIFDFLDGRLARMGGKESNFGREFDSLADVVSFGVAPALMLYRVVLGDFSARLGISVAFFYLLCGSLRLARFNCLGIAHIFSSGSDKVVDKNKSRASDYFIGFPIPAAAGVIVSLTHTLLWMLEGEKNLGRLRYLLLAIMLLAATAMMSRIKYPSLKNVAWNTKRSPLVLLLAVLLLLLLILEHQWAPTLMFLTYLCYGFFAHFFRKEKVVKVKT